MKTILVTLVSGFFICLITRIGVDTSLEKYDKNYHTRETTNQYDTIDMEEDFNYDDDMTFEDVFGTFEEYPIVDIEDIVVYEVEEEVEFENYNVLEENNSIIIPIIENDKSDLHEHDCFIDCEMEALELELFGSIDEQVIVDPKDIVVYEIEENIEMVGNSSINWNPKIITPKF